MKLILHPGHAKCGSTSIQKSIIRNRDLLESHGFLIPDPQMRIRGDKGFNPHGETPRPFFRKLMEDNTLSSLQEKLLHIQDQTKGNEKTVIISAENLINKLQHPAGAGIHKIFSDYFSNVEVLYYIKPIDDYLLSAWQQWGYKSGRNFEKFVDDSIATGNPNYKKTTDILSKIYGENSLDLILLNENFLYGKNLLEDFYTRIGVDFSKVRKPKSRSNISLNPYLCDLLSRSPHLFNSIHDESIKEVFLEKLGKNSLAFRKSHDFISSDISEKIKNRFWNDSQHLVNNYMPDACPDSIVMKTSTDRERKKNQEEGINQILSIQMELIISAIK